MIRTLFTNIMLALAWGAVTGSFALLNLFFGFVLVAFVLWIIRDYYDTGAYVLRMWRITMLLLIFLKELLIASVTVAIIVLTPGRSYRPGFLAFPLRVDRDVEITLLASMLTLTPGTLSVDVSEDKKTLYIHALDVGDPDALRRSIANGFETRIMEALR
jgi:multicomponent Na+:H+ antiporter subunit E